MQCVFCLMKDYFSLPLAPPPICFGCRVEKLVSNQYNHSTGMHCKHAMLFTGHVGHWLLIMLQFKVCVLGGV